MNMPQPAMPTTPSLCAACNGERGREKETSSTTAVWVPCPACSPRAPAPAPLPPQMEVELDGPAAIAVWETALLFAARHIRRHCPDGEKVAQSLLNQASPTLRSIAEGMPADLLYAGYYDDDECSGGDMPEYIKNRNREAGMNGLQIGDMFEVDAVYSRKETWRMIDDVACLAERIK